MYADVYCASNATLDQTLCVLHRSEPIGFILSTIYGVYFVRQMSRISVIHINLRIILCTIPFQYSTLCGTRVLYRFCVENELFSARYMLVMIIGTLNSIVNGLKDTLDLFVTGDDYDLPYFDRHPFIYFLFISSATCFCIIGSSLTYLLWKVVRAISKKEDKVDLSTRFQSMENTDTVQTLFPTICGYSFFVTLCEIFSSYVMYEKEETCQVGSSCSQFYVQMVYISINLYHYFFLLYLSIKFKKLNKLIVHDIKKLLGIKENNLDHYRRTLDRHSPVDEGLTYFQQLKDEWELAEKRQK
ncbi:unnamed protein product [Bursaphelenchus okinawaensis]|uniref:Uncharacterized protein n=1 Tax=Bursaphelenchus okinawaensis TaxID=465554 RepID=A0A811KTP9_9BILA|nr:unnamed protein product [Bursaphelenchus okinawaensis]CAG9113095.1 unnamed protein product [Bursaphelenchus okinawaensis]